MAKYVFVYHGGTHPQDQAEIAQVMQAWENWFDNLGESVIDGGNPVGMSMTVHSGGKVTDSGGSNPVSGYSLIEAVDREDAAEKAKGCPILQSGGTVELAEALTIQ